MSNAETDTTIAKAIEVVAKQIGNLGTGTAATPLGAIEYHAIEIRDALNGIAQALLEVADGIKRIAERG